MVFPFGVVAGAQFRPKHDSFPIATIFQDCLGLIDAATRLRVNGSLLEGLSSHEAISNCVHPLSYISKYPAMLLILKTAQKSLKELMVAAFQKPNRRLNVTSAAVKSAGSASLQPSSIDWLDKCMFPDISLRLCVQMMMLVSRGIGGHLLP